MSIKKAFLSDLHIIKTISAYTISEIYPHYYPKGAVEFFLAHHNENNILNDLKQDSVFLCFSEDIAVGTVTVKENEICRLFVLPEYQGHGFGRELLDFAERTISAQFTEILLDASLPAKGIYLKRGYEAIEFHSIPTDYGDYLCYDLMKKTIRR